MADILSVLIVVAGFLILLAAGIIILVIKANKSDDVPEDLEENLPYVLNCRSFEGRMRGHFKFLLVGQPEPIGEGISWKLNLKPADIKTKNRMIPKEKKEPFPIVVEDNRFERLGIPAERQYFIIYPTEMNSVNAEFRKTPLGRIVFDYKIKLDVVNEEKELYRKALTGIIGDLEDLHITNPLLEEKIRRAKSIVAVEPRTGFGERIKKEEER